MVKKKFQQMVKADDGLTFRRHQAAIATDLSTQTIANREKKGIFSAPKRDVNDHRWYSLQDLISLQMVTFKEVRPKLLLRAMYSAGVRNAKDATKLLDSAISRYMEKTSD